MVKLKIFLFSLVIIMITSCEKTSSTNNQNYFIKATVDGTLFEFKEYAVNSTNGEIGIIANGTSANLTISSNFKGFSGAKTYSLSKDSYSLTINIGGLNVFLANSGSLIVESYDTKTIKGTFSAILANPSNPSVTKQLTSGSFVLPVN